MILLIGVFAIYLLFTQWPDEKLHVVFCDVGQGDSALVIQGNFQAIIDTGENIDKFDKCFSDHVPFWDRKIEALYVSHTDKDHSGLIGEIKNRYSVARILMDSEVGDSLRYGSLHIDTIYGANPNNGGRVLGANTDNADSVVLKVTMNNFSALFTGDLDDKAELALSNTGVLTDIDVLKVPHHGSKYGASESFLKTVKPEVAVISVGKKNTYGHPNRDTLIRLDMVGANVFRTDTMGTIEVVFDGRKYQVYHR